MSGDADYLKDLPDQTTRMWMKLSLEGGGPTTTVKEANANLVRHYLKIGRILSAEDQARARATIVNLESQ